MLTADELDDVGAVPLGRADVGAQRVGEEIAEPLTDDAVTHQALETGRRCRGVDLGLQVVLAARCDEHDVGLPADRGGEGVVGRGVAGVQGDDEVGGVARLGCPAVDRPVHELDAGPTEVGHRPIQSGDEIALEVDTDRAHLETTADEVLVGGQGQHPGAAAEVDHLETTAPVGRHRSVEDLEELLDLTELGPGRRFHPAVGGGDADGDEERGVLGQQVMPWPVVIGGHGVGRRCVPHALHPTPLRDRHLPVAVGAAQHSGAHAGIEQRDEFVDRGLGFVVHDLGAAPVEVLELQASSGCDRDRSDPDPLPRRCHAGPGAADHGIDETVMAHVRAEFPHAVGVEGSAHGATDPFGATGPRSSMAAATSADHTAGSS